MLQGAHFIHNKDMFFQCFFKLLSWQFNDRIPVKIHHKSILNSAYGLNS